ncbi:MAG: hypothetical protein JRN10_09010 [Nitrososphaerota archaeon]|nr:hypothetical protein [Nitrososphaerota archaeon]MDG6931356.1 hypothetical protein [Nitrososphaerota archaeon]MDG6933003.1 hypothetical protein [Nitrososphaerota archaeon]
MALPVDEKVALIVGITAVIIVIVITVRVMTGRKWRNSLPGIDRAVS